MYYWKIYTRKEQFQIEIKTSHFRHIVSIIVSYVAAIKLVRKEISQSNEWWRQTVRKSSRFETLSCLTESSKLKFSHKAYCYIPVSHPNQWIFFIQNKTPVIKLKTQYPWQWCISVTFYNGKWFAWHGYIPINFVKINDMSIHYLVKIIPVQYDNPIIVRAKLLKNKYCYLYIWYCKVFIYAGD